MSRLLALPLLLLSMTNFSPAQNATVPAPPVAKKEPKVTEINGHKLVDNYFWLRDKPNPDVRAYLEAENAYTDAVMKPTEPLQKKLYDEMLSRIKETDVDVPYPQDGYFYYSRTEAGKQYPIRCRRKGSVDAPEQVVIDINELAKGQKFMSLAEFEPSDDGNLLAYSTDNTGFRQYTLHVKDLRTGTDLPDHVEKTGSIAWANDNKTLFYTVEDSAKRQYRVYRHTVGTTGPTNSSTKKKTSASPSASANHAARATSSLNPPATPPAKSATCPPTSPAASSSSSSHARQDIQYFADHHGDSFYIRANDTGTQLPPRQSADQQPQQRSLDRSRCRTSRGHAQRHGFLQGLLRPPGA